MEDEVDDSFLALFKGKSSSISSINLKKLKLNDLQAES